MTVEKSEAIEAPITPQVSPAPEPAPIHHEASSSAGRRLESLDQFRGYTVAGMFLVNFLAPYLCIPALLKHHGTYCSYADTIMPQFFFAVGFAFRLTYGRRVQRVGEGAAWWKVVKRALGLILIALVVYHIDARYPTWKRLTDTGVWGVLKHPLKQEWFQTLVHIAVTTIWVLPVIGRSGWARLGYILFSTALHAALSHWFNFRWVYADPGAIDGGPLGFLTWTIPTLAGSLACDAMMTERRVRAIALLTIAGVLVMALGYGMSCLTTLYNVPLSEAADARYSPFAASPVWPPFEKARDRSWESLLAEPPFTPPPPTKWSATKKSPEPPATLRQLNYWMMSQKVGAPSYLVFASGLSLVLYAAFALVADVWRWRWEGDGSWSAPLPIFLWGTSILVVACALASMIGHASGWEGQLGFQWMPESIRTPIGTGVSKVFEPPGVWIMLFLSAFVLAKGGVYRTFGTNALVGYVLHSMVDRSVSAFTPIDAPAWYVWWAFWLFFSINYVIVRHLEKSDIFIKM